MTRSSLILCGLLLSAPTAYAAAVAGDSAGPSAPDLGHYLDWAVANHPALAGERQRVGVMRDDAARAGSLPELRFSWGEMVVPVETRVGPQLRILSLSQSFPWFGTLGLKEQAAGALADAADEGRRARRLAVERDVRAAWYRLGALGEELRLIRESLRLADAAVEWLRAGYAAGTATYAELLRAEMEQARLALSVADLEDRRIPLTTALNAAAGLPASTPPPPAELPATAPLAAGLPDDEDLRELLVRHNPELAALADRHEGSRLGAEAAVRGARPSFTLGVDYIMTGPARMPDVPDSGKDPVIARLSVGIPLWGSGSAESRAAAGRVHAAGSELSDRRLGLAAKLEQALYVWRDSGRRLELYAGTLLPRADRMVEAATAAYTADQAAYGDLLAARRAQLGLRGEEVRVRLDRVLALNELVTLVGVPADTIAALPAATNPEATP